MKKINIDNYILQNYRDKTNAQMALECGCNVSTISNHRKKLGISSSDLNKKLRDKTEYICSQFGKKTKHQIAKELNCSISFIKKIWAENNLKKDVTYTCNQDFFCEINSHEKAYWLGFIAADGCLYRRDGHKGMISISVNEKDVEILDNIKSDIEYEKPIYFTEDSRREKTKMATLQIVSDTMFNDLLDIGIGVRKTFDLDLNRIFQKIPYFLIPSFILGYFDGDGSIDIPADNAISKSHVRICGPIASLKSFKIFLSEMGIDGTIYQDKRKYTQPFGELSFTNSTQKYLFLKLIYRANVKCLIRKKERADRFIKGIEENLTNRSENIKAIQEYKSVVVKWEELLES